MKTTIAIFCLFCLRGFAADEMVRVTSHFCGDSDEGRTGLFFEIPISKAKEQPKWSPDSSSPPPLSIPAACAAAKKAMKSRYSTTNEFEVRSIELHAMASFGSWYYNIECQTTKFDRGWSPCGMRAVILMDGSNVEPRLSGRASDLAEAMREADRQSFDIEQQFTRARMGDTNALAALLVFSQSVDATKSAGFGKLLIQQLGLHGDTAFARILGVQTSEVKIAVGSHLEAGVSSTKVIRLQRPLVEAFPLTYATLISSP
jgi:hypothetical protein